MSAISGTQSSTERKNGYGISFCCLCTEGAVIAACPAASMVISASASMIDTAVGGMIDGDSAQKIIVDSVINGSIGAVAGASGGDFSLGDDLINDAVAVIGKNSKKRVHPAVKKTAKKIVKKATKQVVKSYLSGQAESFAYSGMEKFTSVYANEAIRRYR